ncbi:hypothetical protein [Bradyrhizobium elkanii]|uniref:hypothetical protein n=1 Tax=Bradyrhizobium elkanii TaxID=29448 RepID=UPI0027155068|nr:hypothetical protein [Bradyrhizobium elkanii]WLB78170.1 hypothetical protein QIH83_27935 [Bradyrhizobium elkanii]
MQLHELVDQVADFDKLPPRDKIKLIGWYLHTHEGKEHFHSDHIRACYRTLHLATTENIGQSLLRMASYNTPDLVREKQGFKLTRPVRGQLDAKYGVHHSVVAVSKILTDLPAKVPTVEARTFLQEALKCYRFEAYRACIVMTWNLAYAHLLDYILADTQRLADFNAAITRKYPKKTNIVIVKYEDFTEELSERETVEIANVADTFNSVVFRILKKELDRRNIAAHPSNVVIGQHQADDMISELVNNVVLALT